MFFSTFLGGYPRENFWKKVEKNMVWNGLKGLKMHFKHMFFFNLFWIFFFFWKFSTFSVIGGGGGSPNGHFSTFFFFFFFDGFPYLLQFQKQHFHQFHKCNCSFYHNLRFADIHLVPSCPHNTTLEIIINISDLEMCKYSLWNIRRTLIILPVSGYSGAQLLIVMSVPSSQM